VRRSRAEASLYERVGALLGPNFAVHSEVDLIGLTDEETFQLIAPRRTLSRREAL
jgi:hypothetical protein